MAPIPRTCAQQFADHLNEVLNRTATHGRLTLRAFSGQPHRFDVGSIEGPLKLNGSPLFLFINQSVEVEDTGKLHTQVYSYRLQTSAERRSWLIRWDFSRERPRDYRYVLSHLHVVDGPERPDAKPIERLHIPTARVPLELVLWHVITEWDVDPIRDEWQSVLERSLEGFADRRSPIP